LRVRCCTYKPPAAHRSRAQLERVRIGRVKTHNNVHVKDPSVSQKHAEVAWSGSAWEVTDLGSSNGTWVNEVEVAREGAPVALADGDELALGEATIFKVSLAPAADAAGPTVEEFLRAQCDAICARLQAEAEAEVKLLREESKLALAELRALA